MNNELVCQTCFKIEATMQNDAGDYLCSQCWSTDHNKKLVMTDKIIQDPHIHPELFLTKPDFLFGVTPGDVVYDIETFPNVFSIGLLHRVTKQKWLFEISFRRNDLDSLCRFIEVLGEQGCRMIGFNNIGFDYPVIHFIYQNRRSCLSVTDIYNKAMSIISANGPAKFSHMVWESDWLVPQIDLFKIHHFDNKSKMTGLKILEFNMRMTNIEDLPFPVGTTLDDSQADTLIDYMWHDIKATDMFADRTTSQLKLREGLSKTFDKNMTNMSDVKIGEVILVTEMEKRGISCYEYDGRKKVKKQTRRDSIDLGQVIFPYVSFESQSFRQIKCYLESKVITETKGVFKGLIATVDGLDYSFGTGGLHMSIESQVVHTDDRYQIVDVDVASFYPNLGIKNKLFPAHLGEEFCHAYSGVYETRKTYAKNTPENGAFKLALNGAYGGSNNEYSPFYDPFYTMSITINGQLLLCMLVEQLLKTPGLRMIQANTDGVTYLCLHEHLDHTRSICRWWEQLTNLELEESLYNRMFVRDVNNYIAEYETGKLKRIGAYAHVTAEENAGTRELPYHKDWSARVVALAAESVLVRGSNIDDFIRNHNDSFDFFLRTKVPRNSSLEWGGEQVGNIVRYYISKSGKLLEKVMPPGGQQGEFKRANKLTDEYFNSVFDIVGLGVWDERIHTKNRSTYEERRSGVQTGWKVQVCNNLDSLLVTPDDGDWTNDIDYDWYIKEVEKIVNPLLQGSM